MNEEHSTVFTEVSSVGIITLEVEFSLSESETTVLMSYVNDNVVGLGIENMIVR